MEKQYIITTEQYHQLKAAWKIKADNKSITAQDIVIYNLLRGKPADRGFCESSGKHIRGNDPWYAYKEASGRAKSILINTNPWEKYKDTPYNSRYAHGLARQIEVKEQFKRSFGIELDGLWEKLNDR